jgi:sodium pump decarboxylase gamma subunit
LSSDFSTGLMISVVGLSITFIALALFIGVIFLLKVLFPYKEEKEEGEEEEVAETPALVETDAEEVAAAIAAVAYAKANQTGKPATGKNPMWTSQ